MDEEISPGNEAGKGFLFLAQVQGDPALVRIEIEKKPALLRIDDPTWKGATLACPIARGFFDFDHVGTEIGHELGRVRRRHQVPQLKHFHPFESLHVFFLLCS